MELKWKEQVEISEGVKLELAEVEDNYKVSKFSIHITGAIVPGTFEMGYL